MALRRTEHDTIPETKSRIAIKRVRSELKPQYLRARMANITLCRENEQPEKRDFSAFMTVLAKQAINI